MGTDKAKLQHRGAFHRVFIVLCFALLFAGCARERASITVNKDGTWTRKTVFTVAKVDLGGPGASKSPGVGDSFALPSGPGWKLTKRDTKDERSVIAERTLKLDETLENDIAVKEAAKTTPAVPPGGPGPHLVHLQESPKAPAILTSNTVTVRQVSPGRYQYTEVVHWKGEMPTTMHQLDEKAVALVKASLPQAIATDENIKTVAELFSREFDLALVGPPSPMMHRLPMMMSAPEAFGRLLLRRIGKSLVSSLKEKFGDQLTAEQRAALTSRLIQGISDEMKASGPDQAGGAQSGDNNKNSTGASIFVSVRLPGRVVETNGIANSFSGDITWSFYPEAAAFGDITLTATCDAGAASKSR